MDKCIKCRDKYKDIKCHSIIWHPLQISGPFLQKRIRATFENFFSIFPTFFPHFSDFYLDNIDF